MVQAACQLLGDDLPLAPGAPNGQVEYRRSLASSLFFKFFLKVSQQLSNEEVRTNNPFPPTGDNKGLSDYDLSKHSKEREYTNASQIYFYCKHLQERILTINSLEIRQVLAS